MTDRIPLHDHSDRNSGGLVKRSSIAQAATGPTSGGPTGTAGGELTGTYPSPSVATTHAGSKHPVLYRLAFAWNTASIATGVTVCSLALGDVILGAWLDVSTAWNSTVSDAGDLITTSTSESVMNATVNMQTVNSGTDRRKLRDGALPYAEQSLLLSAQAIKVKVTSVGISLSAGAATAFVMVIPA